MSIQYVHIKVYLAKETDNKNRQLNSRQTQLISKQRPTKY